MGDLARSFARLEAVGATLDPSMSMLLDDFAEQLRSAAREREELSAAP